MELKKGETIMIDAALNLPASFLHEAFSVRSGVPLDFFELYYRGKRLEGKAALASWGVGKCSTIEVKMRGLGGAGNKEGKQPQKPTAFLEGATALSRANLDLMGDMPIAHGVGDTAATAGVAATRPPGLLLGEHEEWPPEAATLPRAERETMMARLWGTLARTTPGNGTGFFAASAKAIKERLAAFRTKRHAETAASSTAASSSKTPRREEESPTDIALLRPLALTPTQPYPRP